jgi:hypothetical protein
MLSQGDRHFALRLVLYDEDATLGPRIAAEIEDDPRWELIALCATLGDLNFVLNRVTVDILLLHLTPEPDDRVLNVASELARDAAFLVLSQSGVRGRCWAPNSRLLAERELQCLWMGREGELWALLPPVSQAVPTCRTAKDIMAAEAYRWFEGIEWGDESRRCNTLA